MPVYCYVNEDGDTEEAVFPIGKAPESIEVNGKPARRDFQAEGAGFPAKSGWPMECIASGVNPKQAGQLRQLFKDGGVPTEVSSDGNPIYRDAKHRKKALKLRGFVDKSSF